jgi:hypothetical protein
VRLGPNKAAKKRRSRSFVVEALHRLESTIRRLYHPNMVPVEFRNGAGEPVKHEPKSTGEDIKFWVILLGGVIQVCGFAYHLVVDRHLYFLQGMLGVSLLYFAGFLFVKTKKASTPR